MSALQTVQTMEPMEGGGDGTSFSQRCVIIQRDEKGFGLRVSGDNPVFVESVKTDGASFRAGVRPGDRIIKVNGTLVTKLNHSEVVKMIQECGSYVALTLLGLRSGSTPGGLPSTPGHTPPVHPSTITAPLPANHLTLLEFERTKAKTIKAMLDKEADHLSKLRGKEKNGEREADISATLSRMKKLEDQLKNVKQSIKEVLTMHQPTQANGDGQGTTMDKNENHESQQHNSEENLDNIPWKGEEGGNDTSSAKKSNSFGHYDQNHQECGGETEGIISMDSDDEDVGTNVIGSNGKSTRSLETSLEGVLRKEAKDGTLFRFLRQLLSQRHPAEAALFYTLAYIYKCKLYRGGEPLRSAARVWAFQVYTLFLLPDSPLLLQFLDCTEAQLNAIYGVLNGEGTSFEELLAIFDPFMEQAASQSDAFLQSFRQQERIGLGLEMVPISEDISAILEMILCDLEGISPGLSSSASTVNNNTTSTASTASNASNSSTVWSVLETLLSLGPIPNSRSSSTGPTTSPTKMAALANPTATTSTFAMITCILTTAKHFTPRALTREVRGLPLLLHDPKLSSDMVNNNKRHKSLPSPGTGYPVTGPHLSAGHLFLALNSTDVIYCSGCGHVIWAMFGYECGQCFLRVHRWCLRRMAFESPCPGPVTSGHEGGLGAGQIHPLAGGGRQRRWKTSGGRIVDNILRKAGLASSSSSSTLSNSMSFGSGDVPFNVNCHGTAVESSINEPSSPLLISSESEDSSEDNSFSGQTATPSSTTPTSTIVRSESLKHTREAKLEKQRKGSDPSLSILNKEDEDKEDGEAGILSSGSEDEKEEDPEVEPETEKVEKRPAGPAPSHPPPPPPSLTTPTSSTPPPLPPRNKDSKRNDIIKELFSTEKKHVRNLRVLHRIFCRPIREEGLMTPDHVQAVFGNHVQLLEIHSAIHLIFKKLRKEGKVEGGGDGSGQVSVGKALLEVFQGELGGRLEREASLFCANLSTGQEVLKTRMRKDSKLNSFLVEAAASPLCRRLQLKDMLASCFQRITKYPLLLDNLLKNTSLANIEEKAALEKALERTKSILRRVNEAVKREENRQRLADIQKMITINDKQTNTCIEALIDKELVHEGALNWRITRQKVIDVQVVLCSDVLIILTKEGTDRLLLKSQTNPITKGIHSPILKVVDLLTRNVATDSRAFFLVSTKENAVYEFAARSVEDRRVWIEKIQGIEGGGQEKGLEIRSRGGVTKLRDLTEERLERERAAMARGEDGQKEEDGEEKITKPRQPRIEGTISYHHDDGEFISPDQVRVIRHSVGEAIEVVTDEERLRRLDEEVRRLLLERRVVVRKLYGVEDPTEWAIIQDVSRNDPHNLGVLENVVEKDDKSKVQKLCEEVLGLSLSEDDFSLKAIDNGVSFPSRVYECELGESVTTNKSQPRNMIIRLKEHEVL